jgi:NADH:ubiquinone oxidoreductase subunit C
MGSEHRWIEVSYDQFMITLDQAVKKDGYTHLCAITGLDEGAELGFIYHLSKPSGEMLNLHTRLSKDAGVLKSIREYFPGGVIYEKELVDLLGAKVEGLPEGVRYPLPDDWPSDQHPLRKDWDQGALDHA